MEGRSLSEKDLREQIVQPEEMISSRPVFKSGFAELSKQFARHAVKSSNQETLFSNEHLSSSFNSESRSRSPSCSFEVDPNFNSERICTQEKSNGLLSASSCYTSSNPSMLSCNTSSNNSDEREQWDHIHCNKSSIAENRQMDAYVPEKLFNYDPNKQVIGPKTIHSNVVDVENRNYVTENVQWNFGWNLFTKSKNNQGQENKKSPINCRELFSEDQKQCIKIENKLGELHYSGNFILYFSDAYCSLYFGRLGSESILVINVSESKNCDEFVARIEISDKEELDCSRPFQYNKRKLLEMMMITKVYEDMLLFKRNKAYENMVQILIDRSIDISDDISCREDFLQLLMIVRSHNLALDKPLIFLKEIIQNEFISREVKERAERLRDAECNLSGRNNSFPKFNKSTDMCNFFESMRNICVEGINIHRRNLINECPNKSFKLVCLIVNVNNLLDRKILFISKKDIKLFADLLELMNDLYQGESVPADFVKNLWNKFFERIEKEDKAKSLNKLGAITHPIYYFLLKSLHDIVSEVRSKNENQVEPLISFKEGELMTAESITWSTNDSFNNSLEQQYQIVSKLINHFEPGSYSDQNNFNYAFKLLQGTEEVSLWEMVEGMTKERLVWLYIVDSGLAPVLCNNSASSVKDLSLPVLNGFIKFIQEVKQERLETCRVATHNMIQFVTRISPYICTIYSVLTNIDHGILNKQIDVISTILISESKDILSDHFSTLLMIYNEYWEHRDSIISKLPIPCSIFRSDVELFMQKLLLIVYKALSKDLKMPVRIQFLRLYNEFLKHLQSIDFKWLVSDCSYFPELDGIVEEISKNDITSYRVIEPEDFVEILKQNDKQIPKHFLLETVKKLMEIVNMSLDKQDWEDEDCVKAAGDLFLAIGHSFTHFEDQADYKDLEHFLRDCTLPFYCVVENSNTYSDFKRRLDNVENFYVYARKQNQIGVNQAIDLCEQEVSENTEDGFDTQIDRTILEECYNRYSKKLLMLENLEISEILNDINKLKKVDKLPLDKWTVDFKRNVLPLLLANVAAIWSLQESKDVTGIKKKIEPHCVQILCIFRLLGVDQKSAGVPKHFAQVLTGQGKSLILALVSVLIGLTGNEAFVVCYSDYLANRDESSFELFFSAFTKFGLQSKISYNTFDAMANDALSRDINGTKKSLRLIIQDLVLNQLQEQVISTIQSNANTVLLIDEADVFFSENYYGKAYMPAVNVGIPALLKIQPKLWDIVKDGVSDKNRILSQITEFISELLKDESYDDFRNFLKTSSVLFEQELENMVDDAIYVSKTDEAHLMDETYKINEDGVICQKDKYFIYRSNTYTRYHNAFHYFRLKKECYDNKNNRNFGYLQVSAGYISYANLPFRYHNILGVSGTVLNLNDFERKALQNYGIQTISAMPSFFGEQKLVFNPSEHVTILHTKANWLSKIFESVSKCCHLNRAVLVFFETDIEMKLFEENYQSSLDRLITLTGNEDPVTLEWRINEAGVAKTVTLTTRAMGRGIDYKSNDRSVEENGGVHVIQTFFSSDTKEEMQIKGRTARKNNNGSYELILNREHLNKVLKSFSMKNAFHSLDTYEDLRNFGHQVENLKKNAVEASIKETEMKHNLSMEFLESFAKYTPEKRNEYLSKLNV